MSEELEHLEGVAAPLTLESLKDEVLAAVPRKRDSEVGAGAHRKVAAFFGLPPISWTTGLAG